MDIDDIRGTLVRSRIKPETCARVEALIDAIRRALAESEFGEDPVNLPDIVERLPGVGYDGDVAVIPSDGWGRCTPVVLAIARGRDGRSPNRLRNVMREVRAHLISCFEITEVVILLTEHWDPDLLMESVPDFAAYASRASGCKVLIPIVVWKSQLTIYDWP